MANPPKRNLLPIPGVEQPIDISGPIIPIPPLIIPANIVFITPTISFTQLSDLIDWLRRVIIRKERTLIFDPESLCQTLIKLNNLSGLNQLKSQVANYVSYLISNQGSCQPTRSSVVTGKNKHLIAGCLAHIWIHLGFVTRKIKIKLINLSRVMHLGHKRAIDYMLRKFEEHKSRIIMIENCQFLGHLDRDGRDIFGKDMGSCLLDYALATAFHDYVTKNATPIIILDTVPNMIPELEAEFRWHFHTDDARI
jgi:hypothetical protein